jgi:hypothetical protein
MVKWIMHWGNYVPGEMPESGCGCGTRSLLPAEWNRRPITVKR